MSFNESGENTNEGVNNNSLIINSKGDVKDVFTGEITPAETANNSIVINGNGDVKDVSTGEVTPSKPTEEEPFVSSQNEVDLTKYNESLYPPEGSIPERLANGQNTQSFIVATEKDSPAPTQETPAIETPPTEGGKRVIKQNYWDNPEKIKQNFNSFEEAMNDKDAERYNRFQETGENQGEEMSITEGSKWAIPTQENTPQTTQPEVRDLHQEALDSNTKANEGFRPLTPMSANGRNFFASQEKAKEERAKEDENKKVEADPLDAIPQNEMADYSKFKDTGKSAINEASDGTNSRRKILPFGEDAPGVRFGYNEMKDAIENRKLELSNGDIYVTYLSGQKDANGNPISKTPLIFNKEQFDSIQKAIAHQEALDSNAKANEGFTGPLSERGQQALEDIDLIAGDLTGKNFEKSLSELMDEETAKRYMDFLGRDEEITPEPTPDQTYIEKKIDEIDGKIGGIDEKIDTMNGRLGEINTSIQNILQGQEAAQLTQEQLLEYIRLLQEQSQIQIEITQSTAEKYRISMENTLNLIMVKLGDRAPIEINVNQNQSQNQNQEQASQAGLQQQAQQQEQQAVEAQQEQGQEQSQSIGEPQQAQNQDQAQQQAGQPGIQEQDEQQVQQQDGQQQAQEQTQQQGGAQEGQQQAQEQTQQQDGTQAGQQQAQEQNQQQGGAQQAQQQNQQQGGGQAGQPIIQQQAQQQNQQQDGQQQSQQQSQSQTQQGGGTNPVTPVVTPITVTAETDRIRALEDQLRELRGENTPEQRSAALGRELAALEAKLGTEEGLTDAEKIRYFDLLKAKEAIDKELQIATEESEKKRKNKEKWIKIAAGAAGIGVALATPALGVAAVLGITLGGRAIGKGLQSWGNKLRAKSTAIKYEPRTGKTLTELAEMDKKQKRNQWWSDRLGEAGAVLVGGATGYGIGTLFEGIVGKDFYIGMNKPVPEVPVIDGTGGTETGGTDTGGTETGGTNTGGTDTGGAEVPITGPEVAPEPVLVQNGRVNLPGSAWDGGLANGPAQDTLLGGAMNHSNYTGGVHEMAANSLEKALVEQGVTRSNLLSNLETPQVHQLLNRYVDAISMGNTNPDLATMLNSVKPGVSEVLIGN